MWHYIREHPYIESDGFLKFLKDNNLELTEHKSKRKDYIFIQSKYGLHEVRICSIRKGGVPTIQTAVNKQQYFKNRCKEIHSDKYDYTKVDYKTNKIKVEIICSKHGVFLQDPGSHLKGQGCPICGSIRTSNSRRNGTCGWKLTDWKELSVDTEEYDSFKFYVIEVFNEEERFIKIGRTFKTLKNRFNSKASLPYKYNLLYSEVNTAEYIFNLELKIKNNLKHFKYIPNKSFNGMYECFNIGTKRLFINK